MPITNQLPAPVVLTTIESASKPGKFFEIRLGSDNKVYCTCPAWKYYGGQDKGCKHIQIFRASKVS